MSVISLTDCSHAVSLPDGSSLGLLANVSVALEKGQSVSVRGRSGSGKTTLLSILGLLLTPDAGQVHVAGASLDGATDAQRTRARRATIGFVFQSASLVPNLTAYENVELPLLQGGDHSRARRRQAVAAAMDRAQITHRRTSFPRQLSGGEQQRVALARALVRSPAVIIADEPTASLDVATADRVLALLLERCREDGTSIVIATHDPQVAQHAHRRLTLDDGQLHDE